MFVYSVFIEIMAVTLWY